MLTWATDGEVENLGDRDADAQGFNRAPQARRPIGSLVKPFVYLAAWRSPSATPLATLLDDAPGGSAAAGGKTWMPQNADREAHGCVPLIDGLVHSQPRHRAQLGLRVGGSRPCMACWVPGRSTPIPGCLDISAFFL